jgi:hypothetical protein
MKGVPTKFEIYVTSLDIPCLGRRMNKKRIIGGLLAVTGAMLFSAPKAEAGVNVSIGVGVPAPVVYVPAYTACPPPPRMVVYRPVYYAPAPVVCRRVYAAPYYHGRGYYRH